jgi:adenine phosphoribosyltransferase
MHIDAVEKDENILLIDDVLATGGTAEGMVKLIEKAGGNVSAMGFIAELSFLDGKNKLSGVDISSLIQL